MQGQTTVARRRLGRAILAHHAQSRPAFTRRQRERCNPCSDHIRSPSHRATLPRSRDKTRCQSCRPVLTRTTTARCPSRICLSSRRSRAPSRVSVLSLAPCRLSPPSRRPRPSSSTEGALPHSSLPRATVARRPGPRGTGGRALHREVPLLPPHPAPPTRRTRTRTRTQVAVNIAVIANVIIKDITPHPTGATCTTGQTVAPTVAATLTAGLCMAAGHTPSQGRTPRKAAPRHPRRTRIAPRPPRTRSRRRLKSGVTRASPCPRHSSPSRPGARTVARCGTATGTAAGTTSRWTSTSCTRRTATRTRLIWRDTLYRRRATRTTSVTLKSTTPRGGSCRKVCRGKGSHLCCPITRSVLLFIFYFFCTELVLTISLLDSS